MDDRERSHELADATAELAETLEALRTELTEPPEGPLGVPRPPSPRELLRFTEQYTIPTTIALLEAAIRSLELLAAALRVADGRPADAVLDGAELPAGGRDRLATASRETLGRLDDALADLQSAARGEPSNPELARLLGEARELREEVDDRLSSAMDEPTRRSEGDGRGHGSETGHGRTDDVGVTTGNETKRTGPADTDTTEIDVDEELESIKRTVEEDAEEGNGTEPDGTDDR